MQDTGCSISRAYASDYKTKQLYFKSITSLWAS